MTATPAPLYKIANWHALYETRESHRSSGPMKWVPVVTKTDGFGFGLLRQEKNRAELLAAWYLMLGIAAKQPRELRGSLMRDGQPLTAEDLELMTGFPSKIFSDAFAFFAQPRQGWLSKEAFATFRASCAELGNGLPLSAQAARNLALCSAEMPPQDRTGQDRIGQYIAPAGAAAVVEPPVDCPFPSTEAEKKPRDRNQTLDALAACGGADPLQVTPRAWSGIAAALADIKAVCADVNPAEIARRAGNYRTHMREAVLSPHALAKNWALCDKPAENQQPVKGRAMFA
jgi:hypothetical protein